MKITIDEEKKLKNKLDKIALKFISDNPEMKKRFLDHFVYSGGTCCILCAIGTVASSKVIYKDSSGLSSKIDMYFPHHCNNDLGEFSSLTNEEVVELFKNIKHLKPLNKCHENMNPLETL